MREAIGATGVVVSRLVRKKRMALELSQGGESELSVPRGMILTAVLSLRHTDCSVRL